MGDASLYRSTHGGDVTTCDDCVALTAAQAALQDERDKHAVTWQAWKDERRKAEDFAPYLARLDQRIGATAAENDRLRAVVDGSTTSVRDLTAIVDAAVAVDRSWSAVDTLDCPEDFQRALNDLSDAVRALDRTEVVGDLAADAGRARRLLDQLPSHHRRDTDALRERYGLDGSEVVGDGE